MIEQGTPEWHQMRLGRVTASRVADVIAKTKTGWGASRANYMAELLVERLTGAPQDSYTNAAMQHGIDTEPAARAAYEFMRDCEVVAAGFVGHLSIAMSGASPDGFIGHDGLVEFKCPLSATHIDTLLGNSIPAKYIAQMQFQMACTERAWCDWVSFDPRLPASMQLFVQRVPRDDAFIAELEKNIVAFLKELDDKLAALRERYEAKAAPPVNILMAG
jgi:putative phage-type endonuclease